MPPLGNILVVANPAAKNGRGGTIAEEAVKLLLDAVGDKQVALHFTESQDHATDIIKRHGSAVDTVISIGGDGVINEIANGIMQLPKEDRPQLGVIPAGSGNDYALTLGMSSDLTKAIHQLLNAQPRPVDVGLCNGEYFVETLSFGIDAAIAGETMERRKRTGRSGTRLYLESGLDQLFNHLTTYDYDMTLHEATCLNKGAERTAGCLHARTMNLQGSSYLMAVQIGPTYGGHFRVCPDAKTDDGLFDICIAVPKLNSLAATGIFLLAKNGRHTGFKKIQMYRARALDITFNTEPPAQVDGEPFRGSEFHVSMIPGAIRVLFANCHHTHMTN